MPWLLVSPGHQHPWFWLCRIGKFLGCFFFTWGRISTTCVMSVWRNYINCSYIFMPPPLGAGGIMFSGCPSVHPSEAWNTLFWPVHRSVGPPDQPYGMSVRPSGEVSGHLLENAWREWPEILHADVSWSSSELISLWPWSVNFSNFGTILT